jgi:hypothetical protein
MAADGKINVPALVFDAARLVDLAMSPLQALLPPTQHLGAAKAAVPSVRKPRVKKAAVSVADMPPQARAVKPRARVISSAKAGHG